MKYHKLSILSGFPPWVKHSLLFIYYMTEKIRRALHWNAYTETMNNHNKFVSSVNVIIKDITTSNLSNVTKIQGD